jgi:SAM-dependent methyltransferase
MAIAAPIIQTIGAILEQLPVSERRLDVLSLAHPDMLMPMARVGSLFARFDATRLKSREDSASVRQRHGLPDSTGDLPETRSLFDAAGCDIRIVDVVEAGDIDDIVDLNEPLPDRYDNAYDLVIDPGTVEHCFNIGQAIRNAASAVREGGFVLHANPMSMFNHGFYNLNPTLFYDFYSQNGFEVQMIAAMTGTAAARKFVDVPAVKRFRNAPPEARMVSVARRIEMRPLRWPTQTKYGGEPG